MSEIFDILSLFNTASLFLIFVQWLRTKIVRTTKFILGQMRDLIHKERSQELVRYLLEHALLPDNIDVQILPMVRWWEIRNLKYPNYQINVNKFQPSVIFIKNPNTEQMVNFDTLHRSGYPGVKQEVIQKIFPKLARPWTRWFRRNT